MKKFILFFLANFYWIACYASSYAPCGGTEYVYLGDTESEVLRKCGKPKNIQKIPSKNTIEKTRWAYAENLYLRNSTGIALSVNQGIRFSVEFIGDKVNVIYVKGEPVTEYDYCSSVPNKRSTIKQGDSMETVRRQCGSPSLVNKSEEKSDQAPPQISDYSYQFDPSIPATTIRIENQKVTSIN